MATILLAPNLLLVFLNVGRGQKTGEGAFTVERTVSFSGKWPGMSIDRLAAAHIILRQTGRMSVWR
ncbi:hypothetical protein [Paraburkholderia kirstenboschensis]|uniref:hypothetical protein n=1 Tax=Paraburkholderia kirstenboschensis TaxID=1245436 RepID=UPI00191B5573|nr:hypothetical protein [Paraburkholderia kirstenboschensis]